MVNLIWFSKIEFGLIWSWNFQRCCALCCAVLLFHEIIFWNLFLFHVILFFISNYPSICLLLSTLNHKRRWCRSIADWSVHATPSGGVKKLFFKAKFVFSYVRRSSTCLMPAYVMEWTLYTRNGHTSLYSYRNSSIKTQFLILTMEKRNVSSVNFNVFHYVVHKITFLRNF